MQPLRQINIYSEKYEHGNQQLRHEIVHNNKAFTSYLELGCLILTIIYFLPPGKKCMGLWAGSTR
jgi:hypothetical protein